MDDKDKVTVLNGLRHEFDVVMSKLIDRYNIGVFHGPNTRLPIGCNHAHECKKTHKSVNLRPWSIDVCQEAPCTFIIPKKIKPDDMAAARPLILRAYEILDSVNEHQKDIVGLKRK